MVIGIAFEAATPARPKCLTSTPLLASTGSCSGTGDWHARPIPKSIHFISHDFLVALPYSACLLACGLSILSCCRLLIPRYCYHYPFSSHPFVSICSIHSLHSAPLLLLDPFARQHRFRDFIFDPTIRFVQTRPDQARPEDYNKPESQ